MAREKEKREKGRKTKSRKEKQKEDSQLGGLRVELTWVEEPPERGRESSLDLTMKNASKVVGEKDFPKRPGEGFIGEGK